MGTVLGTRPSMHDEAPLQLAIDICVPLAFLIPFALLLTRTKRASLLGTIAAFVCFSTPTLFVRSGDAFHTICWHHGPLASLTMSLVVVLASSLLVWGLRQAQGVIPHAWRFAPRWRRRYRTDDGSWVVPDDLPTARWVRARAGTRHAEAVSTPKPDAGGM